MEIIRSNRAKFEYDIHSLVKAFYPDFALKVLTPESVIKNKALLQIQPVMEFVFGETEVCLKVLVSLHNVDTARQDEALGSADGSKPSGVYHTYLWRPTEEPDTTEYKNAFKRFLYTSLWEETGISLPWGDLIGIRPTKMAMTMLEQGKSEEEIALFLQESHFVSEKKTALGIAIAKRERKILSRLHYEDGYSLYIGIPFCPTTCLYCSFTSYPIGAWKERVADYLSALEKEIDAAAVMCAGKILDTVYIGGGTPSSLSPEELDRLLAKLKSTFDFSTVQEFTVEAGRADSITAEKLHVLYAHGVTRISVNPQTMKQETLSLIGRQHTVEQVKEAFYLAREAGFDNINMDIILGLPGETPADVAHTIEDIKMLSPDALTVHSLAVKRASKLGQRIAETETHKRHAGSIYEKTPERSGKNAINFADGHGKEGFHVYNNPEQAMEIAQRGAADMGMYPYYLYRQKNMAGNLENVGYAREGRYGIYNILIMEEKQSILALGAGATTKRVFPDGSIERCENVKDVATYIERIDEMIERKKRLFGS